MTEPTDTEPTADVDDAADAVVSDADDVEEPTATAEEPTDDDAEEPTAEEPAADGDDLDDLLGLAGAEPTADGAAEATDDAGPADEAEQVEEAEEAAPARPRRPETIDQVRDQRDLRRMRGRWYVLHTYSGYEQRVKDNLLNRRDTYEMDDRIHEIVIPTEEVTEYKKGKKVISDKKFLPGYVLVRMDLDDDTWGVVRHTPAVTGFVGANNVKPVPLSVREVAATLKIPKTYVEETPEGTEAAGGSTPGEVVPEKPQIDIDMEVGETVRVTTGPFADFTGTIAEINLDQAKLRVMVSVFGRETPIEIPFDNVASI